MKLLSIALLAATLGAQTQLTSDRISTCVSASVKPYGAGRVQIFVENKCGIRIALIEIALKYLDKDGYRIGSDNVPTTIAPYLDNGERIKHVVTLIPGSVRAEIRNIVGMQ